jgi:hypothetical protein
MDTWNRFHDFHERRTHMNLNDLVVTRSDVVRRIGVGAAAAAGAALTGALPAAAHGSAGPSADMGAVEQAAVCHLQSDMRKLWEDHITFTRLVIISVAHDLPDLKPTVDRLLLNQDHIGDAIKPFYGDAAGAGLTALLKEHITGAADLLLAAKANDAPKLDQATKAWFANADQIAAFLSAANPQNWPLDAAKSLMHMHLDTTIEEAVARLKGDYAADIAAYDKVHDHILVMADTLTFGIVNQFPDKFVSLVAEQAMVPDLRGVSHAEAVRRIETAGLTATLPNFQRLDEIVPEARDFFQSVPPGRVVSQIPAPGLPVWKGTPVLLAIREA